MDIVQYAMDHHDHIYYLVGGVSLIIELAVIGLGGPLLFFGIAAFITGALTSLGIINGWEIELFTLGIVTGIIALILWKPLKNFQNSGGGSDTSSDMIGRDVKAASDIDAHSGKIRFSGIDWNARLQDTSVSKIDEGQMCQIIAVEGTTMLVKPLNS
ncbi:NfeD family protein [Agaribacterium sp. ZY112]|uniref:NfeD family protein n=1 Tax=Agaribacterium sp. ZY112 TaxID=3233574 RepID=UPI003525794F